MYSVLGRILSSALIALMMIGMVFQAAAEEAQTSLGMAAPEAVVAVDSEPSSDESASEESAAQEPEAIEPQAEATVEPEAAGETETADDTRSEHFDQQIPLAGGQEPSVSVRADRDLGSLAIGDSLMLTCELNGFGGLQYAIRWQACVNGEWRDLSGENSETLIIKVTSENADWEIPGRGGRSARINSNLDTEARASGFHY